VKSFILSSLAALAAFLAVAATATAGGTYTCTGTLGEESVFGEPIALTIDANVDVPAGSTCFMGALVTITGNVTVEGSLSGGFGNTFEKNVLVNGGAISFPLCFGLFCGRFPANHVAGSLIIINSSGGLNHVGRTRIEKKLIYSGNASPLEFELAGLAGKFIADSNSGNLLLFDAAIDGSATLTGNTGGVSIGGVAVGGTLNCEANDPPPVIGPGVTAAAAHGQCGGVESA
jgi:hypothetical protein